MATVILFSQNLKLESLKKYSNYFYKSEKIIILTTHMLFDNEKMYICNIFNNVEFISFSMFLSDTDMQNCDEKAYDKKLDNHNEYVDNIRYQKNKLISEKINKKYGDIKGYYFSVQNDLGIYEKVWLSCGFKKIKDASFYYNISSGECIKNKIKNIRIIYKIYNFLKNALKKPYIDSSNVHVYEEDGFKYILIGKLHRIGYRLNKEFIQSNDEAEKLNNGVFYTKEKAQYWVAWHEHVKCFVPDKNIYDVRWIQDGYLPSNYSDYTYHFKPKNVTYDVWDYNGSLLFKNKNLPYDILPFRKKLYLPIPEYKEKLTTILVATSATGDWTAMKNRSDDDLLVIAFATIAKKFPSIKIIYRCHPDWILPNTVGVNSINRVKEYLNYLNLNNFVLSSNIPNAKQKNGYIQSFSRSSLEEDLKQADLVFGEHSISMIDAGFKKIPFCSVNLTKRRNLFESITQYGFPHCNSVEDITNVISSYELPDFKEKYNAAIKEYNNMIDIETIY